MMTECYIAAKISYILSFAFMQNYSNCSQIPSIFHFAIHVWNDKGRGRGGEVRTATEAWVTMTTAFIYVEEGFRKFFSQGNKSKPKPT